MLGIWLKTLSQSPAAKELPNGVPGCHIAPQSDVILPFNIVFTVYVGGKLPVLYDVFI